MRRIKNGCILLLAVAILLLCGRLPKTMLQFQDAPATEKVYYLEMEEIPIPGDKMPVALSYEDKLSLLFEKQLSITGADAKMTEEEVRKAALSGLKPYAEHHLIPANYEDFSVVCMAFLCYSEEEREKMNVIWNVSLGNKNPELRQNIGLQVDDQTGTILNLNFSAEGFFEEVQVSGIVSEFASVYMNSVELLTAPSSILSEVDAASESYIVYDRREQLREVAKIEFYIDVNGCSTKIQKMQS